MTPGSRVSSPFRRRLLALAGAFICVTGGGSLQALTYHQLDGTVAALSADGTTAVGATGTSGNEVAYRWTAGRLTRLNPFPGGSGTAASNALAISANGAVIVGSARRNSPSQAVRWVNGSTNPVALGLPAGWTSSVARRVSPDGRTVTGILFSAESLPAPFRWTSAEGTQVLTLPPPLMAGGAVTFAQLSGMSDDGSVLVGAVGRETSTTTIHEPFRWVNRDSPEAFEIPAGGESVTLVGLSADGNTAAGYLRVNGTWRGCRWNGTAVTLLPLPELAVSCTASAISADGGTIIGTLSDGRAVRWTADGAEVLGKFAAQAVSADGSLVAGAGSHAGRSEPFIWDSFNGARSLTSLLLRSFTGTQITRYQTFSVRVLRQVGDTLTLIGTTRTPVSPSHPQETSSWVATMPVPTGVEGNPFAGSLLDRTPSFTPALSFTESLQSSLGAGGGGAPPSVRERLATSFSLIVSMEGVDLSSLAGATPVQLVFGGLAVSGRLGDDPAFVPGRTQATVAGLKLSWDQKTLKISINATDPEFRPLASAAILVPAYYQRSNHRTGYFDLDFRFGERRGSRPVVVKVEAKQTSVERADEQFRLSTVKLTGFLDDSAPTLTFITPAARAALFAPVVPVTIATKDDGLVERVRVRLNGGEFAEAVPRLTLWEVPVRPVAGLNTLEAQAIDFNGNASALVATTFTSLAKSGAYAGLVTDGAGEPAGPFTLKLSEAGAFTGKTTFGGKSLSFHGALGSDGTAEVVIGKGDAALSLRIAFSFDGAGNVLAGTLSRGGILLGQIEAARLLFDGKNTQSPWLGAYTVLLPPTGDPETPPGFGYGKLTVSANSAAKLAGKLADGTSFSYGGNVDGRGVMPLYLKLYGTGSLGGQLVFRDRPEQSDFEGTLRWLKPAQKKGFAKGPFTTDAEVIGSQLGELDPQRFAPAQHNGPNARLRFSAGNLAAQFEQLVVANGSIYPTLPAPKFTLKASSDGLFVGSFLDPTTNKVRKYQGAISTKSQTAAGFFLGADEAGKVELIAGFE